MVITDHGLQWYSSLIKCRSFLYPIYLGDVRRRQQNSLTDDDAGEAGITSIAGSNSTLMMIAMVMVRLEITQVR